MLFIGYSNAADALLAHEAHSIEYLGRTTRSDYGGMDM